MVERDVTLDLVAEEDGADHSDSDDYDDPEFVSASDEQDGEALIH